MDDDIEQQTDLPSFMKMVDEDKFEIKTKDGMFIIEDIPYARVKNARKRGEKSDSADICLISEFIVSKDGSNERVGELDVKQFKSSTVTRLMFAINKLMDEQDFQ